MRKSPWSRSKSPPQCGHIAGEICENERETRRELRFFRSASPNWRMLSGGSNFTQVCQTLVLPILCPVTACECFPWLPYHMGFAVRELACALHTERVCESLPDCEFASSLYENCFPCSKKVYGNAQATTNQNSSKCLLHQPHSRASVLAFPGRPRVPHLRRRRARRRAGFRPVSPTPPREPPGRSTHPRADP